MWPGSDRASPQPPAGRAVPSLGPFAELLGQPYQRLKVAVLRQLAGLPEPGWSLADAGRALTWLDPATANRLLSELRSDGLVVEVDRYGQPKGPPAWRLSDEGHLVATVCAVLAAPVIAPERAVKVLAAAMALARAAGVDERAAFAPFVAATAVLERDLAALHRLIDQGADEALADAAEVAAVHLADLAEMARQVARPGGHEPERERAAAVAGRLRALVEEVRRAPELGAPELGAPEPGALEPGAPELGAPELGAPEPGAPEPGAPEPHPPGAGAPEREGSPAAARGAPAVHSPPPHSPGPHEPGSRDPGSRDPGSRDPGPREPGSHSPRPDSPGSRSSRAALRPADLRELVAATEPGKLAGLVAGRLRVPPAVAPARASEALAALDEHLGRPEPMVVPLPEPTLLPIESPEVVPDFVLLAADVMTWLAGLGETDLARWVVGGTWAEATARMAAVVEAWSRWGPGGDDSLAAELDPRSRLEMVGHDEVGIISWTGVRAPAGEPVAQPPQVIDLTGADRSSGGLGASPPDPPRQEVAT
jgi:hypothetical protein